jgi:hypothetical protein
MRNKLYHRVQTLKDEYATGIKLQAEYEAKLKDLRETLMRISGAIQVLEEVIAEASSEENDEASTPEVSPAELAQPVELAAS